MYSLTLRILTMFFKLYLLLFQQISDISIDGTCRPTTLHSDNNVIVIGFKNVKPHIFYTVKILFPNKSIHEFQLESYDNKEARCIPYILSIHNGELTSKSTTNTDNKDLNFEYITEYPENVTYIMRSDNDNRPGIISICLSNIASQTIFNFQRHLFAIMRSLPS